MEDIPQEEIRILDKQPRSKRRRAGVPPPYVLDSLLRERKSGDSLRGHTSIRRVYTLRYKLTLET